MTKYRIPGVVAASVALAGATAVASFAAGLEDPIPAPIRPAGVDVRYDAVARGLVAPVDGTTAPGDKRHLYVSDQNGKIWGVSVRGHHHRRWLVADLSGLLVSDLAQIIPGLPYDERGLLGLAFDPKFKRNGKLYTFTSEDPTAPADFTTQPGVTPEGGQAVVTEWQVRNRHAKHVRVDMDSRRVLMRIDKPQFNHNGGEIAFGPGGLLYISVGDGGGSDDEEAGHAPGGNAQSLAPGNVLGKILRINPHGVNSANGEYGIPRKNPFVGEKGADEIFALGFRNPYRFSFGPRGGLLVSDAGQNDIEEVNLVRRGHNYGWPIKEGTFLFDTGGLDAPGFVTADSPGSPAHLSDPFTQYDHTAPGGVRCGAEGSGPEACQGIAVVGGFRATRGALEGRYVFGDYSRAFAQPLGRMWVAQNGGVRALRDPGIAVFGFGQDHRGHLYVLGNTTGVLDGNTGVVLKIKAPRRHH